MQYVVLDTSTLYRNVHAFSLSNDTVRVLVPEAVREALRKRQTVDGIVGLHLGLLGMAVHRGSFQIAEMVDALPVGVPLSLGADDIQVLGTALSEKAKHPGDRVVLATEDRELRQVAEGLGQEVIDSAGFLALLRSGGVQDHQIQKEVARRAQFEAMHLIASFFVGVAVAVIGYLIVIHLDAIIQQGRLWLLLFGLTLLGPLLYFVRQRFRLGYGLVEILAGVITGLQPLLAPNLQPLTIQVLQYLGGLYVIVRGLENTGKGLQPYAIVYSLWIKVFPE